MRSLSLSRASCAALVAWTSLSPMLSGCSGASGSSSATGEATGGDVSVGGASAGGTDSVGGESAVTSGGKTSTIVPASGGAATGGQPATGGTATAANAGGAATGGKSAIGGTSSTGGAATGGKSAIGGTSSTGGAATGGKSAIGGTSSTGGAATGGKSATGGATVGGASATGGAGTLPRLMVTGSKLTDPSGKTIVLRGSSLIDIGSIYAYSGKNTAAITSRMDKLAAAGIQGHVVRLPVYPKIDYNTGGGPACSPYPYPVGTGPSASCTPVSPFTAEQYYTNILKPAVDYATSKNLYVIIDYHQIDNMTSTGSTPSTSAADAKTFWTDIAPKFASYANVFYEIYNEPIDYQKSWASLKPVVQDIVTTVRAAAPQTVIIVPNNSWDQKPGDAANDPPTGGNLMYTAHIYPSNWTSTGAFQNQVATACSKAPVFITEWGYVNSDYQTFPSTFQTAVDNEGASWTAWVTDNAWTPNMFTDTSLTTLTTFGTQVKTWLAAKATSDWVL